MQTDEKLIYAIKFSKTGNLKYISHLDLMRLFQRAFKRAGMQLEHSKGFNPHPKMSFAQPLSLGFESVGEYLEFELTEDLSSETIRSGLSSMLPTGISILHCGKMKSPKKSMAAQVWMAAYDICADLDAIPEKNLLEKELIAFQEQEEISVEKRKKKTKKLESIDIKPFIAGFELKREPFAEDCIMLTCLVRTGSEANLNPDVLMEAFLTYAQIEKKPGQFRICRKELFFQTDKGESKPLMELIS